MSSVTETNYILGPCDLYVAVLGTAEPSDANVAEAPTISPGGAWVNVGATSGGVTFETDQTVTDLDADQVPLSIGGRITKQSISVSMKLGEITIANLILALNQEATAVVESGYTTLDPTVTLSSSQPNYYALLIDGHAPKDSTGVDYRRRLIVRKTLCQSKVPMTWDKQTPQVLDLTWNGYYVSSSITPWHQVDQTA